MVVDRSTSVVEHLMHRDILITKAVNVVPGCHNPVKMEMQDIDFIVQLRRELFRLSPYRRNVEPTNHSLGGLKK